MCIFLRRPLTLIVLVSFVISPFQPSWGQTGTDEPVAATATPSEAAPEETEFDLDAIRTRILEAEATLTEIREQKKTEEIIDYDDVSGRIIAVRESLTSDREKLENRIVFLNNEVDARTAPQSSANDASSVDPDASTSDEDGVDTEEDVDASESEEIVAELRRELEAINATENDLARALASAGELSGQIFRERRIVEFRRSVEENQVEIDQVRALVLGDTEGQRLVQLREQLRTLKLDIARQIDPVRESREALAADLERIGPPPGDDAPREAAEIADERETLTKSLAEEDAIIRQSELNSAEADRLLLRIDALRRDEFYTQIFRRVPSPISIDMISASARTFQLGLRQAEIKAQAWVLSKRATASFYRSVVAITLSLVVAVIVFGPTRRWMNQQILKGLETREPTDGRKAIAALVRIASRAIPGVVGGAIVYEMLQAQGVITTETAAFARQIWLGFLALLVVDAGAVAAFAPGTPGWRLVPLATRGVRIVRLSFLVATFVFFFDRALSVGAQIFGGDEELALTQSAIKALVMGLMFLWLSSKSVWTLAEGREEAFSPEIRGLWRNLRYALRLISILILVSTVIGYVSFGHYLATRTYMIDGLLAAGLFVRLIAQQGLKAADASFATTEEGSSEERRERLIFFWVGVVVDFIVIAALVPIIALILGAQLEDVRAGVSNAFFGFKIGGVTVSFLKILIAVGTFVGILLVTRFIQRTGERSFLPRTRLDTGVQNSLKTLIGYVGLIIAFGSAVSALGFNLSNLAIIAGALSVGIGFGLQSIVNNFVSGLILLFERPIKVGDWIVTSAGEGIVKRISVRSTEIETFDRSSVIVPNSELISNAVTNWTHKNKQGRVIISVGVSYDTDPDLVIKLLEEVARDTHILLAYPAPYVYFVGFGDSSLDFELRGLIRDVNSGLSAKTGLRVAIFKKLKDAGIEIPFPQRDLNIRTGLYQDKDEETIGDQSASGDEDVKQGTEPWRQIPEGA